MANIFENKDRRVIPNWRSFGKTALLGELNSFQKIKQVNNSINTISIEDYINDWRKNRTVIHGADLLSAAFVNNLADNPEVRHAAEFILNNEDKASKSQLLLAARILSVSDPNQIFRRVESVTFDELANLINEEQIHARIHDVRKQIEAYPNNPIYYVELSRYFSIIGNEERAKRSMKIALHISTDNRFVLRSAARLFVHYDELDTAHDLLRKSPLTNIDPWLASAEISVATLRDRTSRFLKKGLDIISSKNISPFDFTELASSIATVELINGSHRTSRELFSKAKIKPNDNSLAQIEWASRSDRQLKIDPTSFNVKLDFEALAQDSFQNNNFEDSLNNAAKWFLDMPFSKRAVLFGSNLASTILKDQKKSILLLKAGLISHPNDPWLLNNMAYSLALENNGKEAAECISKIDLTSISDERARICITATKGLVHMRNGLPDYGRKLYLSAIDQAKKIGNLSLNWIAILNYAREELLLKSEHVSEVMEVVKMIPEKNEFKEVTSLRKDVIDTYEQSVVSEK